MHLFLDDERNPYKTKHVQLPLANWTVVKNMEQFKVAILSRWQELEMLPDFIAFDHDLGEKHTGYDCANWLVNFCIDKNLDFPPWVCHSFNPIGKENIEKLIKGFEKNRKKK